MIMHIELRSECSVTVPSASQSLPVPIVSHSQAYEQKSGQRHSSTVAGLGEAGCDSDGA